MNYKFCKDVKCPHYIEEHENTNLNNCFLSVHPDCNCRKTARDFYDWSKTINNPIIEYMITRMMSLLDTIKIIQPNGYLRSTYYEMQEIEKIENILKDYGIKI